MRFGSTRAKTCFGVKTEQPSIGLAVNYNHNDIYGVVIMNVVIPRVHLVHQVNVEQRQAAVDPQTKPPLLGCASACYRQLASTTTIAIYYYYSARKLILIYRPTERVEG